MGLPPARGSVAARAAALGVALAAATVAGLLEWWRIDLGGGFAEAGALARSLLVVIGLYAIAGALLGSLAACWPRSDGASGLAVAGAGLALAAVSSRGSGLLLLVAGACLAVAIAWALLRLCDRIPLLASPRSWWCGLALAATAAFARAATGSGAVGWPLALGAAALLGVIALFDLRGLRTQHWPLASAGVAALSVAGSVWLVVPQRAVAVAEHEASGPSLLLITIDTLRADRLGSYGAADARTPVLDALAERGTRFERAYTQNAFTLPSHASILSGNLPTTHGVLRNAQDIDMGVPALAQLSTAGYATAAFPSADVLPPEFWKDFAYAESHPAFRFGIPSASFRTSLLRLIRHAAPDALASPPYRDASDTADAARAWLSANAGRPFFAWVHFFDPHLPYRPPPELIRGVGAEPRACPDWYHLGPDARRRVVQSPDDLALMRACYDAEIEWVDRAVGRIVEAAQQAAPDGRLVVAVTADHGESMGEHGIWWSRDLYDPTLRVPLIIAPETSPLVAVVSQPVRSIDIAPTLLELLGIESVAQLDGRSLLPLMRGEPDATPPPVLSFSLPETNYGRPVASVRSGDWKLIHRDAGWQGRNHWSDPETELYDLRADPAEENDVAGEAQERVAPMAELIQGWQARGSVRGKLSPERRAMLKELGYLE